MSTRSVVIAELQRLRAKNQQLTEVLRDLTDWAHLANRGVARADGDELIDRAREALDGAA